MQTKHTGGEWKATFSEYGNHNGFCIVSDAKNRSLAGNGVSFGGGGKSLVVASGFEKAFKPEEMAKDFFTVEELEANARLMAAAPQLLEALNQCLGYIEMKMAHNGSMTVEQIEAALKNNENVSDVETYHHCGCAKTTRRVNLKAAREAIAKATGQT